MKALSSLDPYWVSERAQHTVLEPCVQSTDRLALLFSLDCLLASSLHSTFLIGLGDSLVVHSCKHSQSLILLLLLEVTAHDLVELGAIGQQHV
jgi:hypothetical protein